MKNIFYFIIGLAVIIFTNTILNSINLSLFSIRPNLTLIYLIYISLYIGNMRASILGLILGLIIDITVGKYFGFYALLFFSIGLLYGSMRDKVFKENIFTILVLVILATFVDNLVSLLIVGFGIENILIYFLRMLESFFINSVVAAFLFYPVNYFIKKVEEQW